MKIKDEALKLWAEAIRKGRHVISGKEITGQRHIAFLLKEKLISRIARGCYLLKKPEDLIEEVFPIAYWEAVEVILSRYTWSIRGISALLILNGDQIVQKQLLVETKEKTNWKLRLTEGLIISLIYSSSFDERLVKRIRIAGRNIQVDVPEKVLIDTCKIKSKELENFIAGTHFDLRTLEALYAGNPKPVIFRRLADIAKDAGRLDLVKDIEKIIETHTYYHIGKPSDIISKQSAILTPPWVVRQEQQLQEYEKAIEKHFHQKIKKIKKHSLNQLLAPAKEHKKYDTYHSTTLEGYRITPEEVDALLSGIIPKDKKTSKNKYLEDTKNRMAILGYSEAFDFIISKIQKDFAKANLNQELIKDTYYHLFKPSADAGIIDYLTLVKYRNAPAFIRGTSYVPPAYEKLPELMTNYESSINKVKNPLIKAILAHYFFVTVHPYLDGNGRTGRILMNYLLLTSGYHWITIRADQRAEYFEALRKGQVDNNILPFGKFLIDMLTNY
ncbi:MAG: Fic family protein [Firmicutes bacterium]|nr:Fic family protein [Bacillota bacterium]